LKQPGQRDKSLRVKARKVAQETEAIAKELDDTVFLNLSAGRVYVLVLTGRFCTAILP
jgi:hypothetical protein